MDACLRFAGEVSPEAVGGVIRCLEVGDIEESTANLWGDAASNFRSLRTAWLLHGATKTPQDIAHLLSGALNAIVAERVKRRVELVWSGPANVRSTLRSTEPALLELLNAARQTVHLVTFAAYKVPAVATAIGAALNRGVRVVLVLENDEASVGKVSFNPLPHLSGDQRASIEVYEWPLAQRERDDRGRHGTLHAKFAVADRARLLVSSANLTEHAFNLNIELGVMVVDGESAGKAVEQIDTLIREGVLRQLRA